MTKKAAEKKETAKVETSKKEKKAKGPKEVYLPLSTNGDKNISQTVSHIRGVGSFVITSFLNAKGEVVGGATNFINGIKPKSKKGERFLIIDKGPKPKKDKSEKKTDKKADKKK